MRCPRSGVQNSPSALLIPKILNFCSWVQNWQNSKVPIFGGGGVGGCRGKGVVVGCALTLFVILMPSTVTLVNTIWSPGAASGDHKSSRKCVQHTETVRNDRQTGGVNYPAMDAEWGKEHKERERQTDGQTYRQRKYPDILSSSNLKFETHSVWDRPR